jgi:anaerobic selenocysteine-containing dehydrogenase
MACMQAAQRGDIKVAFCLGGNLYGSNPDARFAAEALSKVELVVYLNTTLNTGHAWGRGKETLILPVLARDEEPQPTTQESMFNFVRLSDGQTRRLDGPRSEVDVIASLAQAVVPARSAIDWQTLHSHCEIRKLIADVVPGYGKLAKIDSTKEEFFIDGRTKHTTAFGTRSKRAKFIGRALPALRDDDHQLRLMTVRSEGQFNTVVYEEEDIYRGQERRDVILLNVVDIDRLGLRVDQRVTVKSAAGSMRNIIVRAYDIRAGNALMYYPEANALVPTTTDPLSKTPAFKSVPITIEAMTPTEEPVPGRQALDVVS